MMWASSHLSVLPSIISLKAGAESFQQAALPAKENSATELVEIADWSPRDCSLFKWKTSFSAVAACAAYRKSRLYTAVVNRDSKETIHSISIDKTKFSSSSTTAVGH